jgi:hypothetical protein
VTLEEILVKNENVPHKAHQLEGVEILTGPADGSRVATYNGVTYRRDIPGVFALGDQVGAGKTKQIIDSAQVLFLRGEIDTMLVLVPGYARSTWADPDPVLGEVAKHAWHNVLNVIHEYHGRRTELDLSAKGLHWVVTNYEFIRADERCDDLIRQLRGRRTWIVADESWMIKNASQQTRAATRLRRKRAEMATLLNGTLMADGKATDLYYQMAFLDPSITGAHNKSHFRQKYCIMGGWNGKNVVGYQNLDELNARVAPYVRCKKTRECFDLPPMLDPIIIEARLTDSTWKLYRDMRDDMVSWFDGQASVSKQAITKLLRLTQITSGYLGGLEDIEDDFSLTSDADAPAWMKKRLGLDESTTPATGQGQSNQAQVDSTHAARQPQGSSASAPDAARPPRVTKEIGCEKTNALMGWLQQNAPDRFIVWCKFRAELERAGRLLQGTVPRVEYLRGGQTPDQRTAAKKLLAPGSKAHGAVVGNPAAGGASLNYAGAPLMVFLSYGPRLIERTQSIGRIERPGAVEPMLVADVVAVGPKGQKTIDHKVLKALRSKDDMASWTYARWRELMRELKNDD